MGNGIEKNILRKWPGIPISPLLASAASRLNRNQVMEISRLRSRENLVCERKNLIVLSYI